MSTLPFAPRHWLRLLLVSLFAAFIAGCGGGGDSANGTPPAAVTTTVTGTVVSSVSGAPVSGAAVQSGALATTTDGSGRYTLNNVPANATAVITVDASGFARGLARVALKPGVTGLANARLTPIATRAQFNAANGATISVPNSPAQVTLPANGLINAASGAAATGTVTVDVAPIDPAADAGNMPGDFQSATGAIESFGAMSVTLRDNAGNRLNLAANQTSTIRIPVSTRATSLAPTMPLYFLDETTGLWVQEGTATLQGVAPAQYYEGTVAHFTTWNIDRPTETLFVGGCLVDPQNKPVPNATVEANGSNYSGKASGTTDANGNFSVGMQRGSGIATVYATLGSQFSDVQTAGPSNANIQLPKCLQLKSGNAAPAIVQNPLDTAVPAGFPATFAVQAIGSGTLSYQWKRGATDIAGATNAVLFVGNTSAADNGAAFSVTVSNAQGSVTSTVATLTVGAPANPAIFQQPSDQQVVAGQTATFSVQAAAPGQTLNYQWRRNGTDIAGAGASTYTTPATTLADDGALFTVVVNASGGGSITSNAATLHVAAAPTVPAITTQPQDITVTAGQSAVFSVTATGTPVPTYQWYSVPGAGAPVAINGATGSTYTTPALQLADSGARYLVIASNSAGTATSRTAVATVTQATGGAGYYHVAGAGVLADTTITYANGAQTFPSQALYAVREDAPGNGAVAIDTTGGTGIVTFSSIQGTVAGGQLANARSRFSVYVKDGRLWKIDQLVTSGAPVPQKMSTLTPADICGGSGLPVLATFVDGSDWADATRGWIFLRAPGADGLCNSADDTFKAVRMSMTDTTAPVTIGEPIAEIRNGDGSLGGLIVRNGAQIVRLTADLASPTNLFTIDPATFVNAGNVFGSAPPGLWIFVDGTTLYAVNLQNPGTRTAVGTLAQGESLMSHFASDGSAAYVAINSATAGRVLRVQSNLTSNTVMTLPSPSTELVVTPTRVVALLSSTPVSLVSAVKTGGTPLPIFTAAVGDVPNLLVASGENVYFAKLGIANLTGPATIIVGADGTNLQTLAGTRILHRVGPESMALGQGLAQTYAVILITGETFSGLDGGAGLEIREGATRNVLVSYGTFPQTTAQVFMIGLAPLQYRQTALVPFLGDGAGNTTASDLYFIKSDAVGLQRVTTFLP